MTGVRDLPVTVIGGYLGAGKTTLLNHLLTEAHGLRCAVLVNDFGEVNIDAALVARHDGETISLQNGCLCCSMADGFAAALGRILQTPEAVDHIVVEASGVAEPGKIAQTARAFRVPVDGILVVVDAEQVRMQAEDRYVGETVRRQLAQADMVIVNKTDLVSAEELAGVHGWLSASAPAVPTYDTRQARIPLDVLLGVPRRVVLPGTGGSDHEALHRSWVLRRDRPVSRAALARLAGRLGRHVFRAKGFVRLAEEHGAVQLFQLAGRRWTLRPFDGAREVAGMEIVVIGPPAGR